MDALAALRRWPVTVELGGREYTIPPLPASEWFAAVLDGSSLAIVPGLLRERDREQVDDLLAAGAISLEDIAAVANDALEAASGWRWWEAGRLIYGAAEEWEAVGGELALRGVDMERVSLGTALAAIYRLVTRDLKEEKLHEFDLRLRQPPSSLSEEERERIAEEMFQRMMEEAARRAG